MPIRIKIFLIITALVVIITASGMGISIFFAQQHIFKSIEKDLLLVATFADELVTAKINLLKSNALTVVRILHKASDEELYAILKEQTEAYEDFMAITIFDRQGIVAAYGAASARPDFLNNEYMQRAFAGEAIISTTVRAASEQVVFYVCVPMDTRILCVSVSGLLFTDLLSRFKIWETGHIFIDDKEGTVLANPRPEWVLERYNFIEWAKTDSDYQPVANTVSEMVQGKTGIGRFPINGVPRICAFRPITGSLVGWSLGVVAPIEEIVVITQIKQILLIAGSIFLVLGILAASFASRNIAKPFHQIREQNARLEEMNEIALSASKAKSAFLAKMSHEMRTPLNAIIGLSELSLDKKNVPVPVKENLEKVYNSGMILLEIINDLLDISKIESGKFELVPVEYDLPSLINDTINLNIIRVGSKPITFKLLIDENLPSRLRGDELRIKQIFNNLLSNAFKYTREGIVLWRISVEQEGDVTWFISSVQDSGIGIKPEDKERLFTDYNRLDKEKNRNLEGTGLGLALIKKMLDFMDGTITLESEYGKGSTFTVRFRQQSVNAKPIDAATAENLKKFCYTNEKRNRNSDLVRIQCPDARVLVVDDVSVNLDVARGMLKPYGMKVDCVSGGQKAVDIIRKEAVHYNAIFMDHMMPGIDGIEAVRIIREEIGTEYAKTVPIIVLTANVITGNEEMFLNHGFQDFLSKPINIMHLDEVIHRWIYNEKAEQKQGQDTSSSAGTLFPAEVFGHIQDIDISDALDRLDGNEEVLLKILCSYTVSIKANLDNLNIPGKEQLAQYAVIVHGIKGASYNISANRIGEQAEALEQAAGREDLDFIAANHDTFIRSVQKLIADLDAVLESNHLFQKP